MNRAKRVAGSRWAWLVAVLLVLATGGTAAPARAQGASVDQATEEQKTQARELFNKAKEAFSAQKMDEALEGFRSSYAIVASPNSRIMIVQVLDAMGRSVEAYDEAQAVLVEAEAAATADPKYTQTADAARQLRDAIRPQVGLLTVSVPPGRADATLTVGGRPVPADKWDAPIAVQPGIVSVQLGADAPKEVTVDKGGEATLDLTPPPPDEPPPPPPPEEEEGFHLKNKRIIAYIAGGVGAAGLIMFGIFGGLATASYSDIEDQCPSKIACDPALEEDADSGRTYQAVANVSLVVGIVGVAAGAGFFVWDILDPDEPEDGDGDEATAFRPEVVVGPGSLGLRGRF